MSFTIADFEKELTQLINQLIKNINLVIIHLIINFYSIQSRRN
jgi:hypothetical protein